MDGQSEECIDAVTYRKDSIHEILLERLYLLLQGHLLMNSIHNVISYRVQLHL